MKQDRCAVGWLSRQWESNGGFSVILPVAAAAICFLCAFLFDKTGEADYTQFIVAAMLIVVLAAVILRMTGRKVSVQQVLLLIFILSFLLRLDYVLYTDLQLSGGTRQHDVGAFATEGATGHAAYIEWFYYHGLQLPEDPTVGAFYHPPLHHILAAFWMRMLTVCGLSYARAVAGIQFLTLFYTSCCMIVTERILSALYVRDGGKVVAFAIVAFHPTFTLLSGSINNDILATLFILLAVYSTIRWYQDPCLQRILLIAVSIGLGMMTKLTAAVVAVPVAFVFLIKLYQAKWRTSDKALVKQEGHHTRCGRKEQQQYIASGGHSEQVIGRPEGGRTGCIKQYTAFLAVCCPLGLWHPIWKYICYGLPLDYVPLIASDSDQYVGNYSVLQRLLDFSNHPLENIYLNRQVIGDSYAEYNLLVSILKTSVFGEYKLSYGGIVVSLSRALFAVNVLLIVLGLAAMIYCVCRKSAVFDGGLKFFLVFYNVFLVAYYIKFCFDYPHTCSMDFRYIVPCCVMGALFIGMLWNHMEDRHRYLRRTVRCLAGVGTAVFCVLSSAVYIMLGTL